MSDDVTNVPASAEHVESLRLHQNRIVFPDTPEMSRQFQIVADILRERRRQDEKWGEQNHSLNVFMTILTEEVGEAAKEVNDGTAVQRQYLASRGVSESPLTYASRLRTELVQVAAVAMSILEYLDRNDGGSFL